MKFKRELLLMGAAILLALAIWLRPEAATDATTRTEPPPNPEFRERTGRDSLPEQHSVTKAGAPGETVRKDAATLARRRALERLRNKWLELGPGDRDMEKRDALQVETIELLKCSAEMHELSNFLEYNGIRVGTSGGNLCDLVETVFNGSKSSEARDLLLAALRANIPKDILDEWCEAAGRGCAPEDFKVFLEKVAGISNEAARNVMFGRCKELSKTDPRTALDNLLESIAVDSTDEGQKNTDKFRVGYLLGTWETLPPDTDFEALTQALEQYDPNGERFGARDDLFKSWGRSDPAGAANYIMAHPEKYPAELIEHVANTATGDLESALQWVATFPRGAYRDAAALGSADLFDLPTPAKARRFLPLVDDPKAKTRLLEMIEGAEGTIANGDKY